MEEKNAGSITPPPEIQTTGDLAAATAIVTAQATAPVKPEPPIVETHPDGELTLIARNPREMSIANAALIIKMKERKATVEKEKADHEANFKLAKQRKIKSDAYARMAATSQKKIEFYDKLIQALELGYCIVPDMDIEVFAIRTIRKKPKENFRSHVIPKGQSWGAPNVPDQESSLSPAGQGKYVPPAPTFRQAKIETKDENNKDVIVWERWASDFQNELDFPFKLAKPAILNATARALTEKVFDEIGVLPATPKSDPMVIGRIKRRVNGYHWKSVSFVIAWFIDTKDL